MPILNVQQIVAVASNLKKREKMLLYVTLSVVGVVAMDHFVVKPIVNTFRSLDQQVADLQMNVKKSVRLLSQKERMLDEMKEFEKYKVERKSPDEEINALQRTIEELASRSSVNLSYVKSSATKPEEAGRKYYATLECEGQMEQLVKFFYEIESSTFLLRIEKYALQLTAKGSSIIKCAAAVSRTLLE